MPRITDRLTGYQSRYGYVSRLWIDDKTGAPYFTGIDAHDLQQQIITRYHFGDDVFGGESVFAPRLSGTVKNTRAENDGWLLNLVHHASSDRTDLLVIKPDELDNGPVARIVLPQRVPYGFHGTWIPEEALPADS